MSPLHDFTSADVERIAQRDFGRNAPDVVELLTGYGIEEWHEEIDRVRMACLKLAGGDLEQLQRAIAIACSDYRNVLAWAEYPHYMRTRDPEARTVAMAEDARELEEWFHGGGS